MADTTTARWAHTHIVEGQSGVERANDIWNTQDITIGCLVKDRNLTTPPGSPTNGDTYIPLATATGDWVGHENKLVAYINSAWTAIIPPAGTVASVEDEEYRLIVWNGTAWVNPPEPLLDEVTHTAASTAIADDDGTDVVLMDSSSNAVESVLPTLADNQGRQIRFVATDVTNTLTIEGEGAETINGATSISLTLLYEAVTLYASAAEWRIVS